MMTLAIRLCLIVCMLCLSACAARQPSTERATRIVSNYFEKYADRFPDSSYGSNPVTGVQVLGMHELHKHNVVVTSQLEHLDGSQSQAQCVLGRQWPLGWRFQAWERATPAYGQ